MQLPIKTPDEERQIHEPGTYWGAHPPPAKRRPPAGGAQRGPAREAIRCCARHRWGRARRKGAQKPPRLSTLLATSAGQRREQQQQLELESAQILLRGEGLEVAGDGATTTSSSTSRRADLRCRGGLQTARSRTLAYGQRLLYTYNYCAGPLLGRTSPATPARAASDRPGSLEDALLL
jgi:hypothetical protein